jgi:NDP-sugar pyrophosphorylase family protein
MMNIVIPMAGLGSRFAKTGVTLPKPLIDVQGKSLLEHSIDSFRPSISHRFIFIVRKFDDLHNLRIRNIITQRCGPTAYIITLDKVTSGAAETVLAAKSIINFNEELVVYNCDQIIDWEPDKFIEWVSEKKADGAVVCYNSNDPKNSFADVNVAGRITEIKEKKAISNHALIGFHYWKSGKDFVQSAETLLQKFRKTGQPECYVSETYNYLIPTKNILAYHIPNHQYIPLGTPEDVARYIGKHNEFKNNKPRTIFLDLDGTVLDHVHTISDVYEKPPKLLPGVREKLNAWDSAGHRIIITTARKESTRAITVQHLAELGIAYDQLIMGLTGGPRIVINDKIQPSDLDRAQAVNVITNRGFGGIDWEGLGL